MGDLYRESIRQKKLKPAVKDDKIRHIYENSTFFRKRTVDMIIWVQSFVAFVREDVLETKLPVLYNEGTISFGLR